MNVKITAVKDCSANGDPGIGRLDALPCQMLLTFYHILLITNICNKLFTVK